MNRKLAAADIIFYMALPFIIWNYGKGFLGDYLAMLLSTVPGFIYTIYRFWKEKQFNIAGLFIISSLLLSTVVDLASGSAENMIWNGIYLGLFFTFIHMITLIIKRPLALYFAVDFVYLQQGHPREQSKKLFYQPGIFKWYQLIQSIFVIRGLFMAGLKTWLLQKYGVDGYGGMILYRQVAGWTFGALIMGLYFYSSVPINNYLKKLHGVKKEEATST
ncbi:hypothetical protein KQI49_10905 [Virgibacillus sp. MSJ-26]|uniref:VC0807 family protein n=1 Tax=Virgibacillus sp. MSJ-26 TaxID=2841522 RepID=UPI001C10741A|nr:VC0807 family protein [Virgibacillus sp. MSJ-26]MBU5467331.1 hypothetical protein [Virgibacillus sp. MSJ-26]